MFWCHFGTHFGLGVPLVASWLIWCHLGLTLACGLLVAFLADLLRFWVHFGLWVALVAFLTDLLPFWIHFGLWVPLVAFLADLVPFGNHFLDHLGSWVA